MNVFTYIILTYTIQHAITFCVYIRILTLPHIRRVYFGLHTSPLTQVTIAVRFLWIDLNIAPPYCSPEGMEHVWRCVIQTDQKPNTGLYILDLHYIAHDCIFSKMMTLSTTYYIQKWRFSRNDDREWPKMTQNDWQNFLKVQYEYEGYGGYPHPLDKFDSNALGHGNKLLIFVIL